MERLFAIIKMSRPLNCMITFFAILAACFICGDIINDLQPALIGGLAGLFTAAAGNLINDYYDVESDKLNHPFRILPLEIVSPQIALLFFFLFNIMAYGLSMFLGFYLFLIVLITSVLLYLYSSKFKSIPLVGNITVAFLTGLAFLFGSIIVNNFFCGIFPAVFAFLINLMRELIKDIEDVEGDRVSGLSTYPIQHGLISTVNLISLVGVALIILTTIPFLLKIYSITYFIIIMPFVNTILVYVIIRLHTSALKYDLSLSSNLLKIAMIIGIIAILLGSKF
ncbi:MAG: geranylgeranylglycerol-phosphate geranylgeranyltransferase [Bacteroidota bacterium]